MAIKASATITLSSIRDLQSCTRYYLLQSSTSAKPSKPTTKPPGGSWVTAEPSYTAGSTNSLYFCDLNVFSDGSWAYSEVSLSSSYEAAKIAYNKAQTAQQSIDELSVGGRNLASDIKLWNNRPASSLVQKSVTISQLGNGLYSAVGTTDSTGDLWWMSAYADYALSQDPGEYVCSIFIEEGSWPASGLVFQIAEYGTAWHRNIQSVNGGTSVVFTCAAGYHPRHLGFYCNKAGTQVDVRFRVKLERGNRATDWTPAPEDVNSAIEEALVSAEQALANAECIVGTQTASTNAWTGKASFPSLQDGQVIMYWLPYAGTSTAATLNLTLSGGGTTGAKNVYINATTRCTTHIAAGNMVQMVYRVGVAIGSSTYTGWWISRALNDNTYDRIRFNNTIKAKTAISASRLVVGDSGGFFHLTAGSVFDVDKPILWAVSAIAAAATGTNNYLSYPSVTLRNNTSSSWVATQYATLYLAGKLVGNIFTVASENWLTTEPTSETLTYISLGYMYSTYQMYFYPEHPMYRLVDGTLTAISQIAYEAQVAADSAQALAEAVRTDFKRVVRIDDAGLHVGDNQNTNNEVLIDSEAVKVVTGGIMESKFAGSYIQFGLYQLRRTADNGLAFKVKEG